MDDLEAYERQLLWQFFAGMDNEERERIFQWLLEEAWTQWQKGWRPRLSQTKK